MRRKHEIREGLNIERGLVMSPARKRGGDHETFHNGQTNTTNPTAAGDKKKRKVKLKYPVIGEEWGLELEKR